MEVPQEPHLQHGLGQNGVPAMESLPEQSPLNRLIDPTQAMEVTEAYTVPTSSMLPVAAEVPPTQAESLTPSLPPKLKTGVISDAARDECLDGLASAILDNFSSGKFCDIALSCGGGTAPSIRCHRLVLAAAIPNLSWIMGLPEAEREEEQLRHIMLPGFEFEQLERLVRGIYEGFRTTSGGGEYKLEVEDDLAQVLMCDGWAKGKAAAEEEEVGNVCPCDRKNDLFLRA